MDPQRYQRIKEIVIDALEAPKDRLDSVLNKACDGDALLRKEVEELLALDVGQSFLANSPVEIELPESDTGELEGKIGRIRIDHLLAKGGMGEVYAGIDELLERPVAIKIMSAGLRMSALRRSAFLTEARTLSSLRHPNICQVHDFFEDRDRDVLVLELIEGSTLRQALEDDQLKNPLIIARQIVSALAAAHERGIIHRDLKPENVMLTTNGRAKVLDFGLARSTASKVDSLTVGHDNQRSLETQISGTPGYMSPEQARGESATTASDLWSFGLLFSELLTGDRPYPAKASGPELVAQAGRGEAQIPNGLPHAETALLRRLLDAKPETRPTAREVLHSLDRILARPKHRLMTAAISSLVIISMLAGWKYTSDLRREQMIAVEARERAELARSEAEDLVSFMLDELHTGLRSVGRLDLLESVANQVTSYYGELDNQRMQSTRGTPALALVRIAEVLDVQGEREEAIDLLERATAALKQLSQHRPSDKVIHYRLGLAQMNLSELLKLVGRFDEAQPYSDRAIALGRQLTEGLAPGSAPKEQPDAIKRWRLLLRSLYLNADLQVRAGQSERAVGFLEEAVSLAVPAVAQTPQLGTNLADIQFKRCDVYYELARKDLVVDACRETMRLDGELYQASPDNFQVFKNYILDHTTLSKAYFLVEQYQDALAIIDAGERLGHQAVDWEPEDKDIQNDLSQLLIVRGQILLKLGREEEAVKSLEDGLVINAPLAEDLEEIPPLNNRIAALFALSRHDEARKIAEVLLSRNFRRRDFVEICEALGMADCRIPAD